MILEHFLSQRQIGHQLERGRAVAAFQIVWRVKGNQPAVIEDLSGDHRERWLLRGSSR